MTILDAVRVPSPSWAAPQRAAAPVQVPVAIYGNRWCGVTQLVRRALDRAGIDYEYVDLDLFPDAERKLRMLAGGRLRTPVVYVGGEWFMAPTLDVVRDALIRHGATW